VAATAATTAAAAVAARFRTSRARACEEACKWLARRRDVLSGSPLAAQQGAQLLHEQCVLGLEDVGCIHFG
jgi:hypothetical protein